jgi:hypothetical protein
MNDTKICATCEKEKPLAEFGHTTKGNGSRKTYPKTSCRACVNRANELAKPPAKPPLPTAEQMAAIHRAGARR